MNNKRIVAFVFARGGSKGLPGKNIKSLHGKPLIAYSIDLAKLVPGVSDVYVSTDCDDIANVAKDYDAKVIKRPQELAQDDSPEWLAWRHAIKEVELHGPEVDIFLSLPATSPLRALEDVELAIERLKETGADICIGITPAARSPYFNMVRIDEYEWLHIAADGAGKINRRQDAPKLYDITTVVYAAKKEFIMKCDGIFQGEVCGVEVPKNRSVDIDDQMDFDFAEFLLEKKVV